MALARFILKICAEMYFSTTYYYIRVWSGQFCTINNLSFAVPYKPSRMSNFSWKQNTHHTVLTIARFQVIDWLLQGGLTGRAPTFVDLDLKFPPWEHAIANEETLNPRQQNLAVDHTVLPLAHTLKSIRSSFLGSRFFLDPIRALISLADMFRFSPARSDARRLNEDGANFHIEIAQNVQPSSGHLQHFHLEFPADGSGLGVLRGDEPEVELLANAFWKREKKRVNVHLLRNTIYTLYTQRATRSNKKSKKQQCTIFSHNSQPFILTVHRNAKLATKSRDRNNMFAVFCCPWKRSQENLIVSWGGEGGGEGGGGKEIEV